MTLDVTDIINDPDVAQSVTITRTIAPTLTAGRATTLSTSTTTINASVQPMSSRELMLLPEGLRDQGVANVFSQVELLTKPMPDRFTWKSATWEIIQSDDWSATAGYWRSQAARVTK